MKKIIFTLFILTLPIIFITIAQQPPLYKETEHFKVFCYDKNHKDADEIIEQQESFLNQLSHKFQHHYSTKISYLIYADLTSLHEAIGEPYAPDWVIGKTENNNHLTVAQSNPGPCHSQKTVLCANKVGLVTLFITDKYDHHIHIPRWLHQGIALYQADFFSLDKLQQSLKKCANFPTIQQLDAVDKNDNQTFDRINGFKISTSLVHFIDTHWGWPTLLLLLENYNNFEAIFGMSKDAFRNAWIQFLQALKNTENFL